jgi:hypothetical protein
MTTLLRAGALAVLVTVAPEDGAAGGAERSPVAAPPEREGDRVLHPYVGMWVTGDGRVRQELLQDGRYDEARGNRRSAYQGRYEVRGARIDYWDDTGFTADGVFVTENELHHGGMIFRRER